MGRNTLQRKGCRMDKRGQKEYLLYLGCKGMLEPNAIGELTNCLWTFGPKMEDHAMTCCLLKMEL
jgi:hypothetical protein